MKTFDFILFAIFAIQGGPALRAQEQYRIGPGDTFNLRILDKPDTARLAVPVAPDGSISYLQAAGVPVSGLTISQARRSVEEALAESLKDARLIMTPASLGNQSYTILGQVPKPGNYPINGQISLLQAIAASGGIRKASTQPGEFATRADLSRSFVVRQGGRLDVDFEMLHQGDQSQNVLVQPGDYIYVASNLDTQFYVLGAVKDPGLQRLVPGLGVVGALTRQQGFAEGAWKKKVLIVRGSTVRPETYVLDVGKVLVGEIPDVPVQANDILYVHTQPWFEAQKIVGNALNSLVRAMGIAVADKEINNNR